ncbi:hypothetical protein BLNAU_22693 [Blattamonas nauphoetae]|uniref:Uncharacterized protein n=1 Tax=Blattamonas nauphoetae TaxID=2049346 RepID=A0ABQ9WSC3_9EUKA|nr:hypothetical protein BLNAU_22693 [Blattamonas nauphoetae]
MPPQQCHLNNVHTTMPLNNATQQCPPQLCLFTNPHSLMTRISTSMPLQPCPHNHATHQYPNINTTHQCLLHPLPISSHMPNHPWNERASKRKRPKREDSSTEGQVFLPTRSPLRSPSIQYDSSSNWPPEVAWLTQRYQSPATRRTNALSMFEENEIFRKEVGQWIRKSMKGWNGSFTDDVLDIRLRDSLIAGATEMRKDAGIPSHVEFQAIEREGWRKTQERALNGAVQSTLTSIAVTADVLRSLGNMPEDQEKKEQLGQAIALMIDATTRTDSSRCSDSSKVRPNSRSSPSPINGVFTKLETLHNSRAAAFSGEGGGAAPPGKKAAHGGGSTQDHNRGNHSSNSLRGEMEGADRKERGASSSKQTRQRGDTSSQSTTHTHHTSTDTTRTQHWETIGESGRVVEVRSRTTDSRGHSIPLGGRGCEEENRGGSMGTGISGGRKEERGLRGATEERAVDRMREGGEEGGGRTVSTDVRYPQEERVVPEDSRRHRPQHVHQRRTFSDGRDSDGWGGHEARRLVNKPGCHIGLQPHPCGREAGKVLVLSIPRSVLSVYRKAVRPRHGSKDVHQSDEDSGSTVEEGAWDVGGALLGRYLALREQARREREEDETSGRVFGETGLQAVGGEVRDGAEANNHVPRVEDRLQQSLDSTHDRQKGEVEKGTEGVQRFCIEGHESEDKTSRSIDRKAELCQGDVPTRKIVSEQAHGGKGQRSEEGGMDRRTADVEEGVGGVVVLGSDSEEEQATSTSQPSSSSSHRNGCMRSWMGSVRENLGRQFQFLRDVERENEGDVDQCERDGSCREGTEEIQVVVGGEEDQVRQPEIGRHCRRRIRSLEAITHHTSTFGGCTQSW